MALLRRGRANADEPRGTPLTQATARLRAAVQSADEEFRAEPLDAAIEDAEARLRELSKDAGARLDHPEAVELLAALAEALHARVPFRLDVDDLERGSVYWRDGRRLCGVGGSREQRVADADFYARAELLAYDIDGAEGHLEAAIAAASEGLRERARGAVAIRLRVALGTALRERGARTETSADLDVSIGELRRALADGAGPDALAALAESHLERHRLTWTRDDLAAALDAAKAAVEAAPQSPQAATALARAAGYVARATSVSEHFAEACRLYELAIAVSRGVRPGVLVVAARGLALFACHFDLATAARAADAALEQLDALIRRQVDDRFRTAWLRRLETLTDLAVGCHGALGSFDVAVTHAERSRSVLLQGRHPALDGPLMELAAAGHGSAAVEIRTALATLGDPSLSFRRRRDARVRLDAAVTAARRVADFEHLLAPATLDDIRSAASEGPIVYVAPGVGLASLTGAAMAVWPDGHVSGVRMPGCPSWPVPAVIGQFRAASYDAGMPAGARRHAVEEAVRWSWEAVASPVLELLGDAAWAHVVPLGYLSLVPLHAAQEEPGRPTLGHRLGIRYLPTARSLDRLRSVRYVAGRPRLLAISASAGEGDLDAARSEPAVVAAHFPDSVVLEGPEATAAAVRAALGATGWLHAACHGVADPDDAMNSALVLAGGGRLTLREIVGHSQQHLLLAVLSACQTNVPDPDLPNETTSLAAALLLAGCRAVVASAWLVPDTATAALMDRFYAGWRDEGLDVPEALRSAQCAFADGSAEALVPNWNPRWRSPYFWAGFSYLGP